MCGIASIFSFTPEGRKSLSKIASMTEIIRHRGPDDEGFALFSGSSRKPEFFGGKDTQAECFNHTFRYAPKAKLPETMDKDYSAAMGHRRLSILDLSPTGHQPMSTEDGRYVIVYNGEIYNYLELRSELEAAGCRFISNSDTEVILYAYKNWGRDCLHKFNGMFAFVLFDSFEQKIFAARDRFGVKPLYYWFSPSGFLAFASEIKQFTVLPGWRPVLNGPRAYDFLILGRKDHTNETLFDGVYQFYGGEEAECNVSEIKHGLPIKRWYKLIPQDFKGSIAAAAETLRNLFIDSVKLRLRADVPVGTCLSGGLDSSSIVCAVNMLLNGNNAGALQKTFSECSEIERFDERKFIEEVIKKTGVSAHYTFPSLNDLFSAFRVITWHHDEPFFSTSIYAEWCVYKLVAQNGVKVTLDGHAADELLAGYHGFFAPHFSGLFSSLRWLKLWKEMKAAGRLHGYSPSYAMRQIYGVIVSNINRSVNNLLGSSPGQSAVDQCINTRLLDLGEYDSHEASQAGMSPLRQMSYSQFFHTSLPVQLHWADRDSMAFSVESRAPFLDYRVVEFIMGLPDDFKLSEGTTKVVFRKAMKDILPETIRMRMDKMGFVTPEEVWMRESDPDGFRRTVGKAVEQSHGVLRPGAAQKAERIISGQEPFDFFVWRIISFGEWMEQFGVELK